MRILFISPGNAIGGATISLLETVKFLQLSGHTVFVAMPPSAEKNYEQQLRPFVEAFFFVPLMSWNRIQGIGFWREMKGWAARIIKSRGGWLNAPFRIARFIRLHKIDLAHTNTIMALDGALAAKIAGVPHVQHLREITGYGPEALFPMLGQRRPWLFGWFWGKLHTVLIANSLYTKKAYEPFVSGDKIRVVYNSIDASAGDTRCVRPSLQTIGLVANVTSKIKNHLLFIQLAGLISQQMPALNFVIFGKMPPESDPYLQHLRREIAQQNLSEKLVFKGLCNDAGKMFGQIDLLVHTYPYESFGRVFIEAMAHGIPVVAMRGGGADELITHHETGFLFEKNDFNAAAGFVRALAEDQALYAAVAQKGRLFARQFRSEVTGQDLLAVYYGIEKFRTSANGRAAKIVG